MNGTGKAQSSPLAAALSLAFSPRSEPQRRGRAQAYHALLTRPDWCRSRPGIHAGAASGESGPSGAVLGAEPDRRRWCTSVEPAHHAPQRVRLLVADARRDLLNRQRGALSGRAQPSPSSKVLLSPSEHRHDHLRPPRVLRQGDLDVRDLAARGDAHHCQRGEPNINVERLVQRQAPTVRLLRA